MSARARESFLQHPQLHIIEGGMGEDERRKRWRDEQFDLLLEQAARDRAEGVTLSILGGNLRDLRGQFSEIRADFSGMERRFDEHEQRDQDRIAGVREEMREGFGAMSSGMRDLGERVVRLEAHREHSQDDLTKLEEQVEEVRDSGILKDTSLEVMRQELAHVKEQAKRSHSIAARALTDTAKAKEAERLLETAIETMSDVKRRHSERVHADVVFWREKKWVALGAVATVLWGGGYIKLAVSFLIPAFARALHIHP